MPDLSRFAAFGSGAVPRVPQPSPAWGTGRGTDNSVSEQQLNCAVPHVPRVPLENDDGWSDEDWQAAFDERAGILEYMEGLPRAEAERLARKQVFGDRSTGNVKLTIAR